MKIIELLNKIANGEEIPKKIKYSNKIYEFKDSTFGTGYLYEDKGIRYWFSEDVLSDSAEELNYEVEIIEDEEEIDIQSIEEVNDTNFDCEHMAEDEVDYYHNYTRTKMNELVQAVKQLDKNIKELNK